MRVELEQAQEFLLNKVGILEKTRLPLLDALNMIIAENIVARENIPDCPRSALDGYAVIAEDIANATKKTPITLQIIEKTEKTIVPDFTLQNGFAYKISTGGILPDGANGIVKKEDAEIDINNNLIIKKPVRANDNIVSPGENLMEGFLAVEEGTKLTPAVAGVLASMGYAEVEVYKRPKIKIISTGTELCDITDERNRGQIYNSTGYALAAWCKAMGAEVEVLPKILEEKADIAENIKVSLEDADIVITTGGVSVGENDYIKSAFLEIGGEILFHNINIKPGSPTLGGEKNGKLFIGLSGNPAAALIPFNLLVQPVIYKLMGEKDYKLNEVEVMMNEGFPKGGGTRRFLRAKLNIENGEAYAVLTGEQKNGVLTSYVGCDLLVDIRPKRIIEKGDKCTAYIIK